MVNYDVDIIGVRNCDYEVHKRGYACLDRAVVSSNLGSFATCQEAIGLRRVGLVGPQLSCTWAVSLSWWEAWREAAGSRILQDREIH